MKKILFFACCILSIVGFVSCSSDSDDFGVENRKTSQEPLAEFLAKVVETHSPENGNVFAIYDAKAGSVGFVSGETYVSSVQPSLLKSGGH